VRVLGIDEAGRGCVLGPLVVAGYVVDGVPDEALRDAGARDSKTISHEKRLEARTKLEPLGRWDVRTVQATDIDEANLNALEERIIVELVATHQPDVVIVDALGHPRTLPGILARLQSRVPAREGQRWVMEPKADGTYATCGAASIFAKTTRDAAIEELTASFGPLGSGYPHDPITRGWLEGWQKTGRPWPSFVRTRWETVRMLGQGRLFVVDPKAHAKPKTKKAARKARK
jgi:ribonuclease HII